MAKANSSQHPLAAEHDWKTKDPDFGDPDRKGLLLSDQIKKFCEKGLLIVREDFRAENVRPAAYTLTIGDEYVNSKGKRRRLTDSKPSFVMEPNSIVFVSVKEKLDLPYYIAARFNLRVDWVYKGILLGTGPQVEPGFRGYLSCPLYNLTSRPQTITRGEQFATMDFERTTNFVDKLPAEVFPKLQSLKRLERYEDEGKSFLLFKQDEFPPLEKYPKDYEIVSSLAELSREVKMWRNIGVGIVVSFLALTLSLLGLHNNLLRETVGNGKDLIEVRQELHHSVQQQQQDVSQLRQDLGSVKQDIQQLQQQPVKQNIPKLQKQPGKKRP